MAQHNSVNGEHAAAVGMDSPHPLNASAHSTMSAISTSSVQSTNSYARMHQHKVAGHSSASSAASSSYASWARRSKKLKKTASGYAASSTHSSAVSSAAATPKPSRSKGRKIPFVDGALARPSSSLAKIVGVWTKQNRLFVCV